MADSPRLVVDPSRVRVDERFAVRLAGFPPRRRVTVRARMPLDGTVWASRVVVRTDADGWADLDEQAPLTGTADVADAMALVWSMRPTGRRPAWVDRPVTDGNVSLAAAVDGSVRATATVERRFGDPGTTRHPVRESDLVADVYEPAGDGPHPGVVLLGGSSGGFPSRRAASLLAARGYAVLALAYFGTGDLPPELVGVPLEYVEHAIERFAAREAVRADPLGAVGWSRGGELALLAGAHLDRVRTVVAYVPSTVVFQGNELFGDPGSAWTADGTDLPYVALSRPPGFRARLAARWAARRPFSTRPLFERGLDRAGVDRRRAATVPVEAVDGPILLVTGDDDRVWPAGSLATRAVARLDAREYPHRYEHCHVPGAGHDIKVPFHPTTERRYRRGPAGIRLDMGGTTAGYAAADERAWRRTFATLAAGLGS